MKSLIKSASEKAPCCAESVPTVMPNQQEAQCCAKVSKTVAGCHD